MVFVPVPAPPFPAVIDGLPPIPAVPVALESAPPVGPVTTNIELAFVPGVVLTDAGAVPLSVMPITEVAGCVNVASAVGFERPFALLSNGGLQLVIVKAPEKQAMFGDAGEPVVVTVPPAPNGPTVLPLILANSPKVVVHKSPLTGEVGADPWGMFNEALFALLACNPTGPPVFSTFMAQFVVPGFVCAST
jgi:hypothetical protein